MASDIIPPVWAQEGEQMNLKNSRFEWLCKANESSGKKFLRLFAQWACILFALLTIIFMWFIPFLIITVIFAVIWIVLFRNRKTEYEFDYFSGDLTIFKISNSSRRKKQFACNLDNIDYIRKGTDENSPNKKFYFNPDEIYTMKVSNSDGNNILWIEADERFVQILDQERKLRK